MTEINISEWLAKVKKEPKEGAPPIVIVLAGYFLMYRFLYSPKAVELQRELRKNSGIESQIKELESAVDEIDFIRLEVNELQQKRAAIDKYCYKKSQIPEFLRQLRQWGQTVGVEFRSLHPESPVGKTFETITYEELSVRVNFNRDFRQLGMFLRLLEKSEKVIKIEVPEIAPNASGTLSFELRPTIVLLPG